MEKRKKKKRKKQNANGVRTSERLLDGQHTYSGSMYACINTYFYLCTTYEYRVDTLMQKNFNRERADAYGEKKQCTGTNGLSRWFKVGQNRLKAGQSRKSQVYLGVFEPESDTMSAGQSQGSWGVLCTSF